MHETILTATNIPEELKKIAEEMGLATSELDFDLLSYQTFYKNKEDATDEEGNGIWSQITSDNIGDHLPEIEIRSGSVSLLQKYDVKIYRKAHKSDSDEFNLIFKMAANKELTKIVAIISKDSVLPIKRGAQAYIEKRIQKEKLLRGFMIGITDQALPNNIREFLVNIQACGGLKEEYHLVIGEFYKTTPAVNDKIVMHYQKDKEKSVLYSVEEDELILEYCFASNEINGRDCKGNFIEMSPPSILHADRIVINDDSIRVEESSKSIRFYATKSGIVKEEMGYFYISQEVYLAKAETTTFGGLEHGKNKEITLTVGSKSSREDAIMPGVSIEVKTLKLDGFLGANTTVEACDLMINSQTHKKSKIEVLQNATIKLHRGSLQAKEATIETMESGSVVADTVRIGKMSGGEIVAKRVTIDTLHSNATIIALEHIEIGQILGHGNQLIINPMAISEHADKVSEIENNIAAKRRILETKGKDYFLKKNELAIKTTSYNEAIANAQRCKVNNRALLIKDKNEILNYRKSLLALESCDSLLKEYESLIRTLEEKLYEVQDIVLKAVIQHEGCYDGETNIKFVDNNNNVTFTKLPEGHFPLIKLKEVGDKKEIFLMSNGD